MSRDPEFALVPIAELHGHEQIDEDKVVDLVEEIRRAGVLIEPIWVSRDTLVILNGHHRVEALRRMGAERVPAWLLDYESDTVGIEPWRPGPPIPKAEVVRRAQAGHLFPPKTTRHSVHVELPPHTTPLVELLRVPKTRVYSGARGTSRPRDSHSPRSG